MRALLRPDLAERVEASRAGRVVISVLIVLGLLGIIVTNLPNSYLKSQVLPKTQPYINAVGLDQNWGVFAPDPRREVLGLDVRMTYRDLDAENWRPPVRGDLIGTYSDYRWQKFMENSLNEKKLWRPLTDWVVRTQRKRQELPITIALIKKHYDLRPPGKNANKHGRLQEQKLDEKQPDSKLLEGSQ
jgi:hypothetical protein